MNSLSVLIPAYNEEKDILNSLNQNISILDETGIDYEIIIINDGSTDDTKKLIETNFTFSSKLKLHSKKNGGFGSAIRLGIELSTKDYIVFIPVDSPLDQNQITEINKNIGKADVLVSYRTNRLGYTNRMKINSKIFHLLISILFNLRLKDYTWIHVYNRSIFSEHNISIEFDGIFMLPEIIIKAKNKSLTIAEFPLMMYERKNGSATSASYKVAIRTFFDTLKFFIKIKLKK